MKGGPSGRGGEGLPYHPSPAERRVTYSSRIVFHLLGLLPPTSIPLTVKNKEVGKDWDALIFEKYHNLN